MIFFFLIFTLYIVKIYTSKNMTEKFKDLLVNKIAQWENNGRITIGVENVKGHRTLMDFNFDSLDLVELIMDLECEYNITIEDEEIITQFNDIYAVPLDKICNFVETKYKNKKN